MSWAQLIQNTIAKSKPYIQLIAKEATQPLNLSLEGLSEKCSINFNQGLAEIETAKKTQTKHLNAATQNVRQMFEHANRINALEKALEKPQYHTAMFHIYCLMFAIDHYLNNQNPYDDLCFLAHFVQKNAELKKPLQQIINQLTQDQRTLIARHLKQDKSQAAIHELLGNMLTEKPTIQKKPVSTDQSEEEWNTILSSFSIPSSPSTTIRRRPKNTTDTDIRKSVLSCNAFQVVYEIEVNELFTEFENLIQKDIESASVAFLLSKKLPNKPDYVDLVAYLKIASKENFKKDSNHKHKQLFISSLVATCCSYLYFTPTLQSPYFKTTTAHLKAIHQFLDAFQIEEGKTIPEYSEPLKLANQFEKRFNQLLEKDPHNNLDIAKQYAQATVAILNKTGKNRDYLNLSIPKSQSTPQISYEIKVNALFTNFENSIKKNINATVPLPKTLPYDDLIAYLKIASKENFKKDSNHKHKQLFILSLVATCCSYLNLKSQSLHFETADAHLKAIHQLLDTIQIEKGRTIPGYFYFLELANQLEKHSNQLLEEAKKKNISKDRNNNLNTAMRYAQAIVAILEKSGNDEDYDDQQRIEKMINKINQAKKSLSTLETQQKPSLLAEKPLNLSPATTSSPSEKTKGTKETKKGHEQFSFKKIVSFFSKAGKKTTTKLHTADTASEAKEGQMAPAPSSPQTVNLSPL